MLDDTEILTSAQMRAIESRAMTSGKVTGAELMERAGAAVAGQIRLRWPKPGRVTVLCGPGNNGGDGYVIARLLHRAGWRVGVLGLDNTPGPDATKMKRLWQQTGPILPLTETALRHPGQNSDVYVDAIFGTGLTRPVDGEIGNILRYLGGRDGDGAFFRERLIAVDCPSGMCLDSGAMLGWPRGDSFNAPQARMTVTFDSPKVGHLLDQGPALCGDLVVADIGLAEWRETMPHPAAGRPIVSWPSVIALWPEFDIPDARQIGPGWPFGMLQKSSMGQSHKFHHGHALILAGGPGHGGAARLSARAALRIGAGLVTVAPPPDAMPDHIGPPDALMRRPVQDAADLSEALSDKRISAVCLGPGCGVDRAALLLPELLASRRPCVLDADALTALSARETAFEGLHDKIVLTPHMGEFARLFPDLAERLNDPKAPSGLNYADYPHANMADRFRQLQSHQKALASMTGPAYSKLDAARDAAVRSGAVVLLKGPDTVIAAPDGRAVIHSAFDIPWLATAGAGDVLAGIITGLLARGADPLGAASLGTLIHAKAARLFGPGLIADDLPDLIPQVMRGLSGQDKR